MTTGFFCFFVLCLSIGWYHRRKNISSFLLSRKIESILCNSLRVEYEDEGDDELKHFKFSDGYNNAPKFYKTGPIENIEYGLKILNNDGPVYDINGVHCERIVVSIRRICMTNGREMIECNSIIPVLKHPKCSENYFVFIKLHLDDLLYELHQGFYICSINSQITRMC